MPSNEVSIMNHDSIWKDIHAVYRAFPVHYQPAMEEAAGSIGIKTGIWNFLIIAHTFRPDPISVDRLRVRSPYTAPGYYEPGMVELEQRGYLRESPLGGYILTRRGSEGAEAIMQAAYRGMESVPLLDEREMHTLADALGRLVQTCMTHGHPISKWSIIYSRRLDGAPDDSYAAKIDQFVSDLAGFRDDAHLASWTYLGVAGHAWDILTSLWREGPQSIDEVANRLKRRGWSMDETEQSAAELASRGWIEEGEVMAVTEEGGRVRGEAERLTDEYFFAPWEDARTTDIEKIARLLPGLRQLLGEG